MADWLTHPDGSTLIVCDCCYRFYSSKELDADAHFVCPCGRLGQRMSEATMADLARLNELYEAAFNLRRQGPFVDRPPWRQLCRTLDSGRNGRNWMTTMRDFAADREIISRAPPAPWGLSCYDSITAVVRKFPREPGRIQQIPVEAAEFAVAARLGWPAALDDRDALMGIMLHACEVICDGNANRGVAELMAALRERGFGA